MDGFRFDLASVLCRGTNGAPLNSPPLIRVLFQALSYYTLRTYFDVLSIFSYEGSK